MTTALAFHDHPIEIAIDSHLLGRLSVVPNQLYEFTEGLYAFPDAHSFALLPLDREGFYWLQSMEFSGLTFLLIDPFLFVDGYAVDLGETQVRDLCASDPADILVLAILTLPRQPQGKATVNLQGPVAFNLRTRKAKQVAIDSAYGIRHPLEVSGIAARPRIARERPELLPIL